MRKLLLFGIIYLTSLQVILAQCKDCYEGAHWGATDSAQKSEHAIKPHDGSATLGLSYIQQNVCGLAYVQGSVFTATRYTPTTGPAPTGFPTTVAIAGLPTNCLTILKAFVYYGASYTEATAPNTTVTVTNPAAANGTYPSTTTGTDVEVCWTSLGEVGTACYRADVTPIIAGNGNYTINVNGMANAGWEVDGVTLIIIYTTPQTWSGSIALWDGIMSNNTGSSQTYTGTGFTACAATATADAFGCFGDMQNNVAATHTDQFNGTTGTFNNDFWNFDDIPISLTNGQNSLVFNGYTSDVGDCWQWDLAGLYWQNTGCVTCSTTTSTLNLTTTQVNPTCTVPGNATVNVTGGTGPYTYLWEPGGQTNANATGLSVGTYTVSVKDAACDVGVDSVTLINASAPTVTSVTSPITCFGANNGGGTVTVTGGTPGYTYAWTPAGGNTATASGLSAGTYTCTVTDASGCVGTATISLVNPPQLRDSITNTTIWTCTAAGTATVGVKGGVGAYTYSWAPSGGNAATGTSLSAGTYTVTVTDGSGCTNTATATITSAPALTATETSTNVVCFGGNSGSATVTVTTGTAPYTYSWSPTGGNTATANGLSAGTYTCTISDNAGCVITETVTITQAAQLRDSVISTTNASCFGTSDGSILIGVKGGANPLSYKWSNAITTQNNTGLSAGTYNLTITDANGCVATLSATITQPTQVVASVPTPAAICSGSSASLTGNATGGTAPYTYTWNATVTTPVYTVSPLVTTTYTLIATDANGCTSAPVTVTVTINPTPNVLFVPNNTQGCYPTCITFTDQSTPAGTIKSWYWKFGNGDTSHMQNPTECYTSPGVYSVTLTDTSTVGCAATLTLPNLITIYDHPHANFNATPQPADILQPFVQFSDQTVDQYGLVSWFWTFGDQTDSTSSVQNPSHTYQDTGTFCPTLIVTNVHQCTDSVEKCIVIDPVFTLYIPNAFTPNNDSRNNIFLPEGIYICSFEMWIYNRWGQPIYHTTDLNKGWDGRVNSGGPISQEDTYVYLINAVDCLKHTKHSYIGSVTLLK